MNKIDFILESRYVPPGREEMICMSGGLVLIVAEAVLANRGIVLGIISWSVQLQSDSGEIRI
jgi:hypothetical protein